MSLSSPGYGGICSQTKDGELEDLRARVAATAEAAMQLRHLRAELAREGLVPATQARDLQSQLEVSHPYA